MARKGDRANGTGDLNFAAAAMAVGIPLDGRQPAQAVKCESGRDYVRWHLCDVSLDGKITWKMVNEGWREPDAAQADPRIRGFSMVMDFIRTRPRGTQTARDWMDWAHDHLRLCGEKGSWSWPRRLEDVAEFVTAHPEDRAGYVFAYLLNRDLCLHLAKEAQNDPRLLMNASGGHAMLREGAPAWRKKQFLEMIG